MAVTKTPVMELKVIKPLIPSKRPIGRVWTVHGPGKVYMSMIDQSQVPTPVQEYIEETNNTSVYVKGRVIDETRSPDTNSGRIRLEFIEFCESQEKDW